MREVAWYTLEPFEYPDDIRLCEGRWYRIVWIDGQGRRIRLQPGEPVPGLCYFVGPAQPGFGMTSVEPSAKQPGDAPMLQDSTPPTGLGNDVPNDLDPMVRAMAAALLAEQQAKERAASKAVAQITGQKPSLLAALPLQLVAETTQEERVALATMSPLSIDDSNLVVRFVQQPEWMLQLLHEERLAVARSTGTPPPTEPVTSLKHEDRQFIHELLTKKVPAPFVLLCKLLFAYARKYGMEVLDFLPTPLSPPSEADQQRLQNAMAHPQKRWYLEYLHTHQESLFRGLEKPPEPEVSFSSKERTQLRRMMRDTRMVILFERKGYPPYMRFQS